MRNSGYNPDVLSCLANLSSDEVFTPPQLANDILDQLPPELWCDKNTRFLDPFCKSGVFLREITKRLLVGLEKQIPDQQKRLNHILQNQVFGIAITELTALLSRRSVYCSKTANGKYSVCDSFDDKAGNIRFKPGEHTWNNGRCDYCGASKDAYDRGGELEVHAYEFIHTEKPEKIFDMKFDVVIGNPPYQLSDEGAGASASPIYHLFVEQAKKLNPRFLSMIIPARWYAGGKGLDDFRAAMLADRRISRLVDYPVASDVFPGVKLNGGVCYFLWERDWAGDCQITTRMSGAEDSMVRSLGQFDIFVRFNKGISILQKVLAKNYASLSEQVLSRKPFGLDTQQRPSSKGDVTLYANKSVGKIDKAAIPQSKEIIGKWKVLLSMAYGEGGEAREYPRMIIGRPIVAAPPSACTETYIVAGAYSSRIEAENLASFLRTKFVRLLIALRKNTQHITKDRFAFVPSLPMTKEWTDKTLWAHFGLAEEEVAFIESIVRPMEVDDE
ncbi:MAG TPA: Eco57I restriction-modification methylase domain-containing protein [Verrucomicrobiae bacterium]|nr:Eco57I restriction-modification methylase domain-containing protein [Verrucomicrobiae bacterium]